MKAQSLRSFGAIGLALCISGCDNARMSPQIIEADGQTYLACSGVVWASGTGGIFSENTAFKVTFTDAGDLKHTIWGVRKLSIDEPPAEAFAPFPTVLPDPKQAVDVDGKPYVNGNTYTWTDGAKAELANGFWKPVKVAAACK